LSGSPAAPINGLRLDVIASMDRYGRPYAVMVTIPEIAWLWVCPWCEELDPNPVPIEEILRPSSPIEVIVPDSILESVLKLVES
jgi:hypothetical protein